MDNIAAQISSVGQPGSRALWLRWVLAHVLIVSAIWGFGFWLYATTFYGFGGLFDLPLAIIAPFLAQWIGLRRVLQPRREAWCWIVATVIACGLSIVIVVFGLQSFAITGVPLPLSLAIFGGVLGLAQWSVLQRHVTHAFWWIPANASGLAAAVFIGPLVAASLRPLCRSTASVWNLTAGPSLGYCDALATLQILVAGSAVFSSITGTTLVWLVSRKSEVRPIVAGRYLALTAGILCLGAADFATFSLLRIQASMDRASRTLYDISMVSPGEGWAVGEEKEGAAIFHYSRGNWTETSLPPALRRATLRAISRASPSEGWSVGDGSTFLHYANGTWSQADTPAGISANLYVQSVDMLSSVEGWAIGSHYLLGLST